MPPAATPEAGESIIRLHAEAVSIVRQEIAGDTLRISTITREKDHFVDETLTHQRVEIERVPVGRPICAVPPVRKEGDTTILPVVEEIIVVERRLVLKEEVRIRRVHVAEHHQETVVLREQDVAVSRIAPATSSDGGDPRAFRPIAPPLKQEN